MQRKSNDISAASILALAAMSWAAGASAQNATDTVLYSIKDDAGSFETLYQTSDGRLIFRRNQTGSSDERGDTTFYVRETWPVKTIKSIAIDESGEVVSGVVITIVTEPNAISREHAAGGQLNTSTRSDERLEFPMSEKATAESAYKMLKALAHK